MKNPTSFPKSLKYKRTIPDIYGLENLFDSEGVLKLDNVQARQFTAQIFRGELSVDDIGNVGFTPMNNQRAFEELALGNDEITQNEDVTEGTDRLKNSGVIIPLIRPGYNIYGHWLLDLLPKINFFKSLHQGVGYKVLIHHNTPRWAVNIINTLDSDAHCISIKPGEVAEGEFFLMSPIRYHDYISKVAHIDSITPVVTADALDRKRVYLSREKFNAGHRVFHNSKKIEKIFKKNGFSIVYPEELGFVEQINLFKEVGVLAGEAGSALHNSIFCPRDTVVINLQSGRQNHFIQSGLCELYGQTPVYVFGKPDSTEWGANYSVSAKYCKQILKSL